VPFGMTMTFHNLKLSAFIAPVLAGMALLSGEYVSTAYADNVSPPLDAVNTGETPFPTCDDRTFLAKPYNNPDGDPNAGELVTLDLSSDPLVLVPVGDVNVGYSYNAMAYNPADDFLYAIKM